MKIGPKYKIARRLGAAVFEKTQTAKFALSLQKKGRNMGRRKPLSVYGTQLIEKQKVRFTYGLSEKQFSKYVKKAVEAQGTNTAEMLYQSLETRLDSVVLRAGFANSRSLARQIVSHGHMKVNGVRVNVPSYRVQIGDVVTVKDSSTDKVLFQELEKMSGDRTIPAWIEVDIAKKMITIKALPPYDSRNIPFDLLTVIQFYKR